MNLALLAPLGLFALGALLLPVLLHLARRTPQRRTDFAALRWLTAKLRPRRRIRVEEPWLLLLRLLLVACVALLFARPVWTVAPGAKPWVLVHPALAGEWERASDCTPDDCDWRWLAPGFPAIDADAPAPPPAQPVSSLLREVDALMPAGTVPTVAVPSVLDGVDAERPRLARPVDWRVLPVDPASPPSASPARTPPFRLRLQGEASAPGRAYLRAAARANGWTLVEDAAQAGANAQGADAVAWLDAAPPPAALLAAARAGGTLWLAQGAPAPAGDWRVAWRDAAGEPVASTLAFGRGRLLQWRRVLAPESLPLLLEPAFPRGLAEVLQPAPASTRAAAEALRPRTGGVRYTPPPRPLDAWLLALAVALFALERLAATRPARLRAG